MLSGGSNHSVDWFTHNFLSELTLLIPQKNQGYNPLTKWDEPPNIDG